MRFENNPSASLRSIRQELITALDQRGVNTLDLLPAAHELKKSDASLLYFPLDWHLSPKGHAFVATQVAQRVRAEDW